MEIEREREREVAAGAEEGGAHTFPTASGARMVAESLIRSATASSVTLPPPLSTSFNMNGTVATPVSTGGHTQPWMRVKKNVFGFWREVGGGGTTYLPNRLLPTVSRSANAVLPLACARG
jgi:hypothetical protein